MIVKFFDHGSGRSDGLNYLLDDQDHAGRPRPVPPRVVAGDFALTAALVDASPYKKHYTSGVLRFTETDLPESQKMQIIQGFEETLFPGLDRDRFNTLWVEHRDHDGQVELHFVVANLDLATGKRLQPYYDRADLGRVNAWKNLINHRHGFTDPCDPDRRRLTVPPAHKLPKAAKAIQGAVHASLRDLALSGELRSRADVLSALAQAGYTITRSTASSISIASPFPGGRNIRLKGALYAADFAGINPTDHADEYHAQAEARAADTERLYARLMDRRREYLAKHHPPLADDQVSMEALISRLSRSREWRQAKDAGGLETREQRSFFYLYQQNAHQRMVDGWRMFRDRADAEKIVHWHPETRCRMVDEGNRITCSANDEMAIRRMIELGDAKGWRLESIQFFGSPAFLLRAEQVRRRIIAERAAALETTTPPPATRPAAPERKPDPEPAKAAAPAAPVRRPDPIRWWDRVYADFVSPPRHLHPEAAERRKQLARRFQYCDHPAADARHQVRREAILNRHPKLAARLRALEEQRPKLKPPQEWQLSHLRNRISELSGIRHWSERRRLKEQLRRLEQVSADATAKLAALNQSIQKLIDSCPSALESAHRRVLAAERQKQAEELLSQEKREAAEREVQRIAIHSSQPPGTPGSKAPAENTRRIQA